MLGKGSKTAYLGLFCAAAILLGSVEAMVPVFTTVPGMTLGLPNQAVVTVLYLYSWREAALVSLVRITVNGLLFGNLFSFWFSLAGGLLSLAAMAAVKVLGLFDCTGVSLVGGIAHNAGQIAVAALLVDNVRVAYYFIPLVVTGLVAGVLIGLLSGILVRRLAPAAPKLREDAKAEEKAGP